MSPGVSSVPACKGDSDDSDDEGFPHLDMDSRPVDPFRFSQATLEDTQEDELNAILGELSALQLSLDREIKAPASPSTNNNIMHQAGPPRTEQCNNKPVNTSSENGGRTDSPDNDSGFSDNASLLSSGSSLSASGSSSGSSTASCRIKPNLPPSTVIHANEDEKAEKIRVALAKMRAASVTRLYVKAFSPDGSSKALMVEESMSCGRVLALLADKNHVPLSHKWALVEYIPHLHMERIYEDHENMVDNLLMWNRDSKNKIYFVEREDKYDMFSNPQRYFMEPGQAAAFESPASLDEHTKHGLIEEFFGHGVGVPEVESVLYLKAEGKKAWKKFPFVLRASGIYYYPKGRSHASSSKDLVCLATIDHNTQAYEGIGWRKKFKAPTEYGFVLKPARLQVKSHKHMKYLCAEDPETLRLWMVGLRIAKHGKNLWDNYRSLQEDIAHEDLDRFGRSVSLASMPIQISTQAPTETLKILPIRKFSLESSNNTVPKSCAPHIHNLDGSVERSVLLTSSPFPTATGGREEGFELDCPVGGTIKRKPSTVLSPKIPLTLNTRSLVSEYITSGEGNTVTLNHTLGRKRSGSGSSASGSSACSTPNTPQPTGKPPLSTRLSSVKPVSVAEETFDSLEYENLPPPPPELLTGGCGPEEAPNSCVQGTQFQAPPPPPLLNYPTTLPYNHNLPPKPLSGGGSHSQSLPKKGVSFASELSQRLQSRQNTTLNLSPGPKKLDDPPQTFLSDLQRVMQKKWQVAQKCGLDKETSPQEILGFRFEPTTAVSPSSEECQSENGDVNPATLNNVRAWVSQHYGSSMEEIPESKPVPPPPNAKPQPRVSFSQPAPAHCPSPTFPPPPVPSDPNAYHHGPSHGVVIYENFSGRKTSVSICHPANGHNNVMLRSKKPPPPIPKRADSTHLSAHFVYN